ncbi:hypothetical protein C0995_001800 [Termitomyces sp. Mi166|nr:hypothetical protein C0995_001800 [Termitomyces sp. Mi166\
MAWASASVQGSSRKRTGGTSDCAGKRAASGETERMGVGGAGTDGDVDVSVNDDDVSGSVEGVEARLDGEDTSKSVGEEEREVEAEVEDEVEDEELDTWRCRRHWEVDREVRESEEAEE